MVARHPHTDPTEPWPIGRAVDLGARGTAWVLESPGPRNAPTLLLLHGLGCTAAINWFGTFRTLGERYRLIALDHRGHGRGLAPSRRFRLADCADDAAALLDALEVGRVVAVGYSMGGPIAQLLWQRHPRLVCGLVLCATSRNFRGRRRASVLDLVLSSLVAPGLARTIGLVPVTVRRVVASYLIGCGLAPELRDYALHEIERHVPRAVVEAATAIARFDSAPWTSTIDVPSAVVVMEQDTLISPRAQRKLAASIPGATLHALDAGHDACVSQPHEFANVLAEACDGVVRRTPRRSLLERMLAAAPLELPKVRLRAAV